MRSLIDGVDIKLLTSFATIKVGHNPKIRKLDAARASRVLKGPPRARLAAFPYTRRPKKPATTMITTTTPMM
jgi:hypothetical protein